MVFQALQPYLSCPIGLWAPHTWAFLGPFPSPPSLLQSWLPLHPIGPRSGLPLFLQSKLRAVFHFCTRRESFYNIFIYYYCICVCTLTYLQRSEGQLLGTGSVLSHLVPMIRLTWQRFPPWLLEESFFLNSEMCVKTICHADVDFLGVWLIRLKANICGQLSQGLIWKVRPSFLPQHLELGRCLFLWALSCKEYCVQIVEFRSLKKNRRMASCHVRSYFWLTFSVIYTLYMCIYVYVYLSYLPTAVLSHLFLSSSLLLLTESLSCFAFGDPLTLMRTAYMSRARGSSP